MAAEDAGWHEEAAKLCGDEDLVAAAGDRSSSASSIFNLDDINLDDIFLDLNDADMFPALGADGGHTPLQGGGGGGLFSSGAGGLQGSGPAPAEDAPFTGDGTPAAAAAAGGGALLSEGLQLCDDIDVTELEWLSNFCEESYSSDGLGCFIPCNTGGAGAFYLPGDGGENKKTGPGDVNALSSTAAGAGLVTKDERHFRTSSPISVLEHGGLIVGMISPATTSFSTSSSTSTTTSLSSPTSSSCSGVGGLHRQLPKPSAPPPEAPGLVPARSRTKRPRPANFSPRPPIVIPPPPPSETSAGLSSEDHDDCFESSGPVENKKKKKKRPTPAADFGEEEAAVTSSSIPGAAPVRKCMHCEITKTPQWRAGPMGPKTLCNACGVRYKSGRLFPEYRPAASPTFVAALHSNSHKKVVEMRNKTILQEDTPASAATAAAAAGNPGSRRRDAASKACELLEYIRRREWCCTDSALLPSSD